jgi:hypothetical protein
MNEKLVDFGGAFLRFHSDRVQNTARLQLDALCTLTETSTGASTLFALTAPCIGEDMYQDRNLIQSPGYEFRMIASERSYRMIKNHPSAEKDSDVRRSVGEVYQSFNGLKGRLTEIVIHAPRAPARELPDYGAFEGAFLRNLPLVGITEMESPNGQIRARLEYPVRTSNLHRPSRRWQVDAGPALVPDFHGAAGPLIQCLARGYLVYHSPDWAEIALHQPAAAAPWSPRKIPARNRLFALGAA